MAVTLCNAIFICFSSFCYFFSVLAELYEVYVINASGRGMLSDFAQVVGLIAVLMGVLWRNALLANVRSQFSQHKGLASYYTSYLITWRWPLYAVHRVFLVWLALAVHADIMGGMVEFARSRAFSPIRVSDWSNIPDCLPTLANATITASRFLWVRQGRTLITLARCFV